LGSRKLLLGIFFLALAYGGYTTLARVSAGSPSAASAIAMGEMLGSAPGVLAGWLGDRKGLKVPAALGTIASLTALVKPSPASVFLTLSFFYSSFLAGMIEATKEGEKELGMAVSALSLGWGVGVITVPYAPILGIYAISFLIGSLVVFLGVRPEPAMSGLLAAVPKLWKLLIPLSLFIGSEYVAYALTALRFFQLTDKLGFALSYAVGPSLTATVGGYLAGMTLKRLGPERMLMLSMLAYVPVVLLALMGPPPYCLIAWSVPVYPFYEVSLVSLVTKHVPEAPASALGLTYTTTSIASLVALPMTEINSFPLIALITSMAMIISTMLLKVILNKL